MKTRVYVCFHTYGEHYNFDMDKETFIKQWNNHIHGIGFFTGKDEEGKHVIINPSQCGVIEINSTK